LRRQEVPCQTARRYFEKDSPINEGIDGFHKHQ
jgi:hypothetical protein